MAIRKYRLFKGPLVAEEHRYLQWKQEFRAMWDNKKHMKPLPGILINDNVRTPRRLLAFLRKEGFLSERSKGRVLVLAEWPRIEVVDKTNYRSLLTLECMET